MAEKDWTTTGSHFSLTIDGLTGDGISGLFSKVKGLGVEIQAVPMPEGGQNNYVHQLPGPMKWQNIELERGVMKSDILLRWLKDCSGDGLGEGQAPRGTGSITMYQPGYGDVTPKPLRRWSFTGAFPIKWSGPDFDAESATVVTEKFVIAHAGLTTEKP